MMRIPAAIAKRHYILYPLLYTILIIADEYPQLLALRISLVHIVSIAGLHLIALSILLLSLKAVAKFMKARQVANAVLFFLAPGIPLEFLSSLIEIYGTVYTAIPIVGTVTLCNLVGFYKGIAYIVLVTPFLQLLFIPEDKLLLLTTVRIAATAALILASLLLVNSIKKHSDVDIFKIANAWMKFMFTGNGEELEEVLDSVGEDRVLNARILLFDREEDGIAIIVPTIHFGPYRTIGSTYLPYAIEHQLEKYSVKAFVLHGAGSHELNLTKRECGTDIVARLVQTVTELKLNPSNGAELFYEPFRVYDSLREAMCLQTESTTFVIISSPVIGGDDLPYELQEETEKIAKLYGFRDAAIVDAHNVQGSRELRYKVFEPLIKAALSKRSTVCSELRVGYGEDSVTEYVRGLCNRKVKALAIECNKNLYALIYLYGNNAATGVRESLRRAALEKGFKDAELITLDDHSCAGVVFDVPYHAVELSTALVKAVDGALTKALQNLKTAVAKVQHLTFKARVASTKIFELIEVATDIGSAILNYLKTVLPVLYVTWFMLVIVLKLLIL